MCLSLADAIGRAWPGRQLWTRRQPFGQPATQLNHLSFEVGDVRLRLTFPFGDLILQP